MSMSTPAARAKNAVCAALADVVLFAAGQPSGSCMLEQRFARQLAWEEDKARSDPRGLSNLAFVRANEDLLRPIIVLGQATVLLAPPAAADAETRPTRRQVRWARLCTELGQWAAVSHPRSGQQRANPQPSPRPQLRLASAAARAAAVNNRSADV